LPATIEVERNIVKGRPKRNRLSLLRESPRIRVVSDGLVAQSDNRYSSDKNQQSDEDAAQPSQYEPAG
jgi:hypothetical protein